MTTATRTTDRTTRALLTIGAAAVVAMLVNAVIATGALALGPGAAPVGLTPAEYLSASVVGILIGAAGWALVRRFTARPAAVLRVLVPVVVVLTWIPDVAVLLGGATVVNAVGLMLMHAVVATSAVVALRRVLPV
ncbi:DUF6069 family protein [Pseudonocardia endophytica]|uniref:Uncharacterized protein n=1 Tax=Pseudonocardia endophytica TaxID=401976 RepID=A0A4R1HXH0_PSEEN|nr:DUF6069 family protein [Pseudonocardia endophytica]TCK26181.1 hypothetical protein EV378_2010 [Pseudonocardia endophytica]